MRFSGSDRREKIYTHGGHQTWERTALGLIHLRRQLETSAALPRDERMKEKPLLAIDDAVH